jgi:pimeloyl-ACP methyl ester carboxylesterase
MHDHPAQRLPQRPEDVPAAVDAGLLRAVLAAGRPQPARGDAAKVVVGVHGLGHDAWDFGPLQQRAPSDLTVAAIDLPGFGPGRVDDDEAAPVDLADLVAALVAFARRQRRPPVVVASSLGGHAALIAALEHPGVFAGLALLAPGGLVEVPQALQAVLRGYYGVEAIVGRADDDVVRNSRRIFVRPGANNDALAARKLALHRAPRAIKQRFAVPFSSVCDDVLRRPVLADVHRLKGLPMTVIFGDGDVVVPLSSGRYLEERCGARLHIFDRCGHCPHLEDTDRTADVVFAFARDAFAAAQKA